MNAATVPSVSWMGSMTRLVNRSIRLVAVAGAGQAGGE